MSTDVWEPLSVYGTIVEQKKQYVLRFQRDRFYFKFEKHNDRSKLSALRHAQYKQKQLTLDRSKVNHILVDRESAVVRIKLFCENSYGNYKKVVGEALVDADLLPKVSKYYWSVRYDHYNRRPLHVCSKKGSVRTRLDHLVYGAQVSIDHIDNNLFNCCRSNLILSDENHTLSDEETVSDEIDVGEVVEENVKKMRRIDSNGTAAISSKDKVLSIEPTFSSVCRQLPVAEEHSVPQLPTTNKVDLDESALAEEMSRFCFADGPYIPKSVWLGYRERATASRAAQAKFSQALAAVLLKHYPLFPVPNFPEKELVDDLQHVYNTVRKLNPRSCDFNQLTASRCGNMICKHFAGRAMMQVSYSSSTSQKSLDTRTGDEIWVRDACRIEICRIALTVRQAVRLTSGSLWSAMNMSFYIPSNFPAPACAHLIDVLGYRLFVSRKSEKAGPSLSFLDPCSGWGGRFVGFWMSRYCGRYVGIDPNPRLPIAYRNIGNFLSAHFPTQKTYQFIESCAEEGADWISKVEGVDLFDILFTSPPYFDVELYGREPEQSAMRYGTYADWLDGFLTKMLMTACTRLKEDAFVVLNVADCKRCPTLVQDTVNVMEKTLGFKLVERVAMMLPRRPYASNRDKSPSEPILVFQK